MSTQCLVLCLEGKEDSGAALLQEALKRGLRPQCRPTLGSCHEAMTCAGRDTREKAHAPSEWGGCHSSQLTAGVRSPSFME